jgi:hypothetical protein
MLIKRIWREFTCLYAYKTTMAWSHLCLYAYNATMAWNHLCLYAFKTTTVSYRNVQRAYRPCLVYLPSTCRFKKVGILPKRLF